MRPSPYQIQPDVKKIAVLRANAIGDFMFSLPALDALRAAYPSSEIVLLGQPWHAEFLRGRPGPLDRVIAVPPLQGIRGDEDGETIPMDAPVAMRFFECMQGEHFDLAIQLHGGGRYSNPVTRRLGARLTAGLYTPDAELLDLSLPFYYYQSEVWRALEVVSLVGAPPVTLEPRIALAPDDAAVSNQVVPPTDKRLVLVHPGAGDGRRRWPPAKFAQVADALAARGAQILVSAANFERELVEQVIVHMREEPLNICGRLSLRGLAGLLSRCALVLSNDSGPLHLAQALGAPTVGIYWCGNLITAGPMTRARHRPVISWQLTCPVCGNNCTVQGCEHHESFVADVPVEPVLAHALDLLGL